MIIFFRDTESIVIPLRYLP